MDLLYAQHCRSRTFHFCSLHASLSGLAGLSPSANPLCPTYMLYQPYYYYRVSGVCIGYDKFKFCAIYANVLAGLQALHIRRLTGTTEVPLRHQIQCRSCRLEPSSRHCSPFQYSFTSLCSLSRIFLGQKAGFMLKCQWKDNNRRGVWITAKHLF